MNLFLELSTGSTQIHHKGRRSSTLARTAVSPSDGFFSACRNPDIQPVNYDGRQPRRAQV